MAQNSILNNFNFAQFIILRYIPFTYIQIKYRNNINTNPLIVSVSVNLYISYKLIHFNAKVYLHFNNAH